MKKLYLLNTNASKVLATYDAESNVALFLDEYYFEEEINALIRNGEYAKVLDLVEDDSSWDECDLSEQSFEEELAQNEILACKDFE